MRLAPESRRIAVTAAIAAGAAAAIGWLIASAYRRDLHAARARIAASALAETKLGPIEYAIAGEGPPVLIVHGAGGGYDQGMELAQPLVGLGFRVIAVSRFGYLRTPLPLDASPAAQADAHAGLLDALGIARAPIVGVSAGAPSAMQFALRHPQRCSALVLAVPAAYVSRTDGSASMTPPPLTALLFGTALQSDFLFWVAPKVCRDTIIRSILATSPALVRAAGAAERARVASVLEHILPVSERRAGLLNDAAVCSALERYELERIEAPTLVLTVADDLFGTFDTARYTAAHVPGAKFVAYATGGHLWVGHHDEALSEIATFLGEAAKRA
jgi:pimeloyl-ACP methyl ester carboxylesterase